MKKVFAILLVATVALLTTLILGAAADPVYTATATVALRLPDPPTLYDMDTLLHRHQARPLGVERDALLYREGRRLAALAGPAIRVEARPRHQVALTATAATGRAARESLQTLLTAYRAASRPLFAAPDGAALRTRRDALAAELIAARRALAACKTRTRINQLPTLLAARERELKQLAAALQAGRLALEDKRARLDRLRRQAVPRTLTREIRRAGKTVVETRPNPAWQEARRRQAALEAEVAAAETSLASLSARLRDKGALQERERADLAAAAATVQAQQAAIHELQARHRRARSALVACPPPPVIQAAWVAEPTRPLEPALGAPRRSAVITLVLTLLLTLALFGPGTLTRRTRP